MPMLPKPGDSKNYDIRGPLPDTLPAECCAKCVYGKMPRNNLGEIVFEVRECHALPPHVQFFLVPQMDNRGRPIPGEAPAMMEHSGFPKMPHSEHCGYYKMRPISGTSVEIALRSMDLDLDQGDEA